MKGKYGKYWAISLASGPSCAYLFDIVVSLLTHSSSDSLDDALEADEDDDAEELANALLVSNNNMNTKAKRKILLWKRGRLETSNVEFEFLTNSKNVIPTNKNIQEVSSSATRYLVDKTNKLLLGTFRPTTFTFVYVS